MAEEIRKIIIPQGQLPPINGETGSYRVRYRIVSDDRNRVSAWTNMYELSPAPRAEEDLLSVTLEVISNVAYVSWPTTAQGEQYDVYMSSGSTEESVGSNTAVYKATVSSNYISIPVPSEASFVQFFIQLSSVPRQYVDSSLLGKTTIEGVV